MKEENSRNHDNIVWQEAIGTRGPYEKANPQSTDHFKALLTDLKAHDGKLSRKGYFYWLFGDGSAVGRKKLSK